MYMPSLIVKKAAAKKVHRVTQQYSKLLNAAFTFTSITGTPQHVVLGVSYACTKLICYLSR